MNIDISQIGYRWKGIYSPYLSYANNDVVYKDGGAYVIRNGAPVPFALGQQDAVLRGHLLTGGVSVGGFGNMVLHATSEGPQFQFQDTRNGTLATMLGNTYDPGSYYQSVYGISIGMHDGSVRSLGYQTNGFGGAGSQGDIGRTFPARVAFPPGTPRIVKIRHGWDNSYYLDAEGGLWSAGVNNQNMTMTGFQCNLPTKVNGYGDISATTKIVDIDCALDWHGPRQGFAIDDQGRVYGFGNNNYNVQGISGTSPYARLIPFTVDVPMRAAFCSGGNYAGSALISREGQLWVAGHIDFTHGNREYPHSLWMPWGTDKPVKAVRYTESDNHIADGTQYFRNMVIVLENGDLYAMGNVGSQVSHGFGINYNSDLWYTNYANYPPRILTDVNDAVCVNGGYGRMLALRNDGTVWHTGYDGFGIGGGTQRTTWAQITHPDLTNGTLLKMVGARYGSSAYLLRDNGTVISWGRNEYGVRGVGNATDGPPTSVAALDKTIVDFQVTGQCYDSTSNQTMIMLTSDGQVYASGSGNYSVNGDDDSEPTYVPRQILF